MKNDQFYKTNQNKTGVTILDSLVLLLALEEGIS